MSLTPYVELRDLDHLWFQVSGTLCNLRCHHCFISCSPDNDAFGMMSLSMIEPYLKDSVALGVKEYYFTGGEPFLNPEMLRILERTLALGPATVLTNATILPQRFLGELARLAQRARFSLELRVSLDGPDAQRNDPIRGAGSFELALRGLRGLVQAGFLPIVTVMQSWEPAEELRVLREFVAMLRSLGCDRPRLKIIPSLKLGAEALRSRPYLDEERVRPEMMEGFDQATLYCSHSRTVTDKGVYVCPILIEAPDARLGQTLSEARVPFALRHQACFTCYLSGAICSNASSGSLEVEGW
jgi:molybdenum cofactor biosynthesis enzyme MoaA